MSKEYLIGTDIGTSGTKSVLIGLDGRILASSLVEYTVDTPTNLWAEQWPNVWLDAVKKTIRQVVDRSEVDSSTVAGVCISSLYGGSGVPCDEKMEVVRPCIIWMDRRATREGREVEEKIGIDRLFSITGNTADPYFGYTKILWIKNNEPENWKRIKCFLTPNAYVIYHLTGETAVDYTSAGNLGGVFDMKRRAWSYELMEALGIPAGLLPHKLVNPSSIVGGLTRAAAEELGLKEGTPVCAGAIDCLSATLSAGVIESGQHVAVIGTSVNWGVVHEGDAPNPKLVSMPYVMEPQKKLYTYGGASTAGALPRWFRDNFAQMEKQAELKGGPNAYQVLDKLAEGVAPGSEGLIILPYFMGERTPIWDTDAKGTILGLSLYHRKEHIYRAFLESVAYSLRHIMESFGQNNTEECILVGGAAKSRLWKQIFADVLGIPVVCPIGNIEAPLGDALIAGVGTGVLKDFTVAKDWLKFEDNVVPDNGKHKIYTEYFNQYKDIYPKLAVNMKELTRISSTSKNQ